MLKLKLVLEEHDLCMDESLSQPIVLDVLGVEGGPMESLGKFSCTIKDAEVPASSPSLCS